MNNEVSDDTYANDWVEKGWPISKDHIKTNKKQWWPTMTPPTCPNLFDFESTRLCVPCRQHNLRVVDLLYFCLISRLKFKLYIRFHHARCVSIIFHYHPIAIFYLSILLSWANKWTLILIHGSCFHLYLLFYELDSGWTILLEESHADHSK